VPEKNEEVAFSALLLDGSNVFQYAITAFRLVWDAGFCHPLEPAILADPLKMPITILLPYPTADRCYLREALLWTAFNRFPLQMGSEKGVDVREDREYRVEELDPYLPFYWPIDDGECARAGLPPNPEYEALVAGKSHASPEVLRDFLSKGRSDESGEFRRDLERQLSESIEFHRRQARWDDHYHAFVDAHQARLFLALLEGRLSAHGKELPRRMLRYRDVPDDWDDAPWMPIPPDFWRSKKINWSNSSAEGRSTAYGLIMVDCEDLFDTFPPPKGQDFAGVMKIANSLVLSTNGESEPAVKPRRGRPPFDWDAFHLELARRLKKGDLPKKQEALVADMQAWCKASWSRDVGRSTILQKVKPYFDAFSTKSENVNE
jgi:hypothetical protein